MTTRSKTHIIEELGTCVPLNVVSVKVTPLHLDINPVLVASSAVENVFSLRKV
jgi:hypothetical protein